MLVLMHKQLDEFEYIFLINSSEKRKANKICVKQAIKIRVDEFIPWNQFYMTVKVNRNYHHRNIFKLQKCKKIKEGYNIREVKNGFEEMLFFVGLVRKLTDVNT